MHKLFNFHTVSDFAATIPWTRGAEEIMAWYDADPTRQVVVVGEPYKKHLPRWTGAYSQCRLHLAAAMAAIVTTGKHGFSATINQRRQRKRADGNRQGKH